MNQIQTWQEQYNPTVFKNKGRALRWNLMQKEIDELRKALNDATGRTRLTKEQIEFGLNCNLEDSADDEAIGFYAGVNFAERMHKVDASPAQPVFNSAIDFLPHDDHLRFIQRVLESDAPKSDRDAAAQMARDLRRSVYTAQPSQAVELSEAVQNLIDATEGLMAWQVKNVQAWHNGAYDTASMRVKQLRAAINAKESGK